jgi:hypothetical protein
MITLPELTSFNIFLIWLSIFFFALFLYSFLRLRKFDKNNKVSNAHEQKKWLELEEKAQKDYQEVLEAANKRAQEIILQATEIKNDTTNKFNNAFEALLESQKQTLEKSTISLSSRHLEEITKINSDSIALITNIYKDFEITTKADLDKYKTAISQQTFEAEKLAAQRMKDEYIKLEKEIADRRTQKLQALDTNIYKLLTIVSKDVIGKALDFSDQEELVAQSLDKAKKEGVI